MKKRQRRIDNVFLNMLDREIDLDSLYEKIIPCLVRIYVCKEGSTAVRIGTGKNHDVRPGQTIDVAGKTILIELPKSGGTAKAHGTYQVLCCVPSFLFLIDNYKIDKH